MTVQTFGDLIVMAPDVIILSTGQNDDVLIQSSIVELVPSVNGDQVTGFATDSQASGEFIMVACASETDGIVMLPETGSAAENQLVFLNGASQLTLGPGESMVFFRGTDPALKWYPLILGTFS